MDKRDRDAYARKNVLWLSAVFGGVVVLGLLQEKTMGVIAGLIGLGWIGRAFWRAR